MKLTFFDKVYLLCIALAAAAYIALYTLDSSAVATVLAAIACIICVLSAVIVAAISLWLSIRNHKQFMEEYKGDKK